MQTVDRSSPQTSREEEMEMLVLDNPGARTMAGVVKATAYYSAERDGVQVLPDHCPVANVHRRDAERRYAEELKAWQDSRGLPHAELARPAPSYLHCTWIAPDGDRRWCRYYYGLARRDDETARIDLSMLRTQIVGRAARQTGCTVLCTGQTRNRPPGV